MRGKRDERETFEKMRKYRKTHGRFCKSILFFAGITGLCVLLGGCGKDKEEDLAGKQVLEISITPAPTPTPEPSQLNPDAVVTEGRLTMVNGYLVDGIGVSKTGKGTLNSEQDGTEAGGSTDAVTGEDGDGSGDSVTGEGADESGASGAEGDGDSGENGEENGASDTESADGNEDS